MIKFYNLQNKFIGSFYNYPATFTEGIVVHPNGFTEWWLDNKLHRIDGAAIIWKDITKEWWVYGKFVTELEHKLLYDIMKLKALI